MSWQSIQAQYSLRKDGCGLHEIDKLFKEEYIQARLGLTKYRKKRPVLDRVQKDVMFRSFLNGMEFSH